MKEMIDMCKEAVQHDGRRQGQIAYAVGLQLEEQGDELTPTTVASCLSQLLNDDLEGMKFFLSKEGRCEALAGVLGLDQETFKSLRKKIQEDTHLLLDPRLPKDVRDFVKLQEAVGEYRCVLVEPYEGEGAKNALKRVSQYYSKAIIVTNQPQDESFFEESEMEARQLEEVPRGWKLVGYEGLIPVPPPAPPILFGEDGVPMIPYEALQASVEDLSSSYNELRHRTARILERGEVPTYTVEEVIAHVGREHRDSSSELPEKSPLVYAEPVVSEALFEGSCEETFVWLEGEEGEKKTIHATGPALALVQELFGAHHDVVDGAEQVEEMRMLLLRQNPFILWACRASGEYEHHTTEVGAEISGALGYTKHDQNDFLWSWSMQEIKRRSYQHGSNAALVCTPGSFGLKDSTRELLQGLMAREWKLNEQDIKQLFVMHQIMTAPILEFATDIEGFYSFRAKLAERTVAHLGVACFPELEAQPIKRHSERQVGSYASKQIVHHFDGGDVHLWLTLVAS